MIGQRCSLSLLIVYYILNILQQCSRLQCLTIDNRIVVTANDCYTRISIGSKLSDVNIVSRIVVASLTECEDQCSKNGNTCNAFTFGVDPSGNGTCAISTRIPTLQDLETHTDYDVYVKTRQGSPWCNVDRLYQDFTLGNGTRLMKIGRPNKEGTVTNIYGNSYSKSKNYTTSYGLVGAYDLFNNHDGHFPSGDDNHRVLDILANRNQKPATSSPFVTICHRKLQPGKKMVDLLIERVLTCENVQDCRRACDYEKAFACKGFNHRRGMNGSNDTCELTSTPYFRMNGDRDFLIDSRYDYYEKDSTCLPSVRPGGTVRWMDRVKVYGQHSQDTWSPLDREDGQFIRSFTGDHARSNHQFPQEDRRDFASRQNTPNWNGNYWRGPEARYPSTVNDDVNPLHDSPINYNEQHSSTRPSSLSKSRLGERPLPRGFFTPRKDEEFYRKSYDYGIAFGYNDNYVPSTKEFPYGEQKRLPVTSKCSIKLAAGSKLSRNVLRKTCLARDSRQCEDFCVNEIAFPCGSFAYRYNLLTTNPTDNCLLSDVTYENVNFYTDLEPDRDYDSWIISHDSKACRSKGTTNRYSSEECFLRVRSGFSMPADITKKSMLVDDLGGCQFACTMSQEFLCRSFAFKYATEDRDHPQERASPNCLLSDWPSVGINPADMPDVDGAELYERISSPSSCEPPIANSPLPITDVQLPKDRQSAPTNLDEICYSQYHRACKLMPHAIVSSTRAATKSECCQKCSTMRNIGSIPCMSFNYMVPTVDTRDNCLLSIISVRDLRPNLDYTYDDDQVLLYMWKDLDPYCSLTVNSLNSPSTAAVPDEHGEPFPLPPTQMNTAQRVPDTGTGTFQQIFFPSDPPTRSEFRHENHECDYKRNHAMCNYDVGPRLVSDDFEHRFGTPPPRDLSIFRRYTVNGHPCRNGSVCQRNEIAGYWSCEIEENEQDSGMESSWDYCCEPNHRCGFSQGYHYPWCYVGSNEDQWRPCSETYYPYPYYLPLPRDYHSLNSELSAYSGRHWPIIYLHETLPPNCTVGN